MSDYILGINCFMHDSASCLIKEGQILAFAEEERFNRIKHTGDFPINSISYCLKEGNISINDISYIGYYWVPWRGIFRKILTSFKDFPRNIIPSSNRVNTLKKMLSIKSYLKKEFGYKNKVYFIDHHKAHIASSFYPSGFETCAILIIDANGEIATTTLGVGKGNKIDIIKQINYPHSIGLLYLCVTEYLGFKENCEEGKVMALASYGKPTFYDKFKKIIYMKDDGEFLLDTSYFDVHLYKKNYVTDKFIKLFGPKREKDKPIEERHIDIAASLQKITEDIVMSLVKFLYNKTKLKNLCLGGGVTLNSVMNGKIEKEGPFQNIFIPPTANDSGTSLGSALYIYHNLLNKERSSFIFNHAYFGPSYTTKEVEDALKKYNLKYIKEEDIALKTAKLISEGKIIGWFQGKMEVGPRALGNRSILADPRRKEMKEILNMKIKEREYFQPFAPSVLEEKCGLFFSSNIPSPFMLKVYDTLPDKISLIPAVVHVDQTARVQTVNRKINPLYYRVIEEFEKITGIPMVLNTSFNLKGEPIVCSPEDAILCYLKSGIDILVIDNFIIEEKKCIS